MTSSRALACMIAAAGCTRAAEKDGASAAPPEPAAAAAETASADVSLTDAMVKTYLTVRKKDLECLKEAADRIRASPAAEETGSARPPRRPEAEGRSIVEAVVNPPGCESKAAAELGRDVAEYRRVKSAVAEANLEKISADLRALAEKMSAGIERQIGERLAKAQSAEERRMLQGQLAAVEDAQKKVDAEAARHAATPEAGRARRNLELLARFETELKAVEPEWGKPAAGRGGDRADEDDDEDLGTE
jgi:hypothetical protein